MSNLLNPTDNASPTRAGRIVVVNRGVSDSHWARRIYPRTTTCGVIANGTVVQHQRAIVSNPPALTIGRNITITNCQTVEGCTGAAVGDVEDAIRVIAIDDGGGRTRAIDGEGAGDDVQVAGGVGILVHTSDGQDVGPGGEGDGVRAAAGGAAVHGCIGVG